MAGAPASQPGSLAAGTRPTLPVTNWRRSPRQASPTGKRPRFICQLANQLANLPCFSGKLVNPALLANLNLPAGRSHSASWEGSRCQSAHFTLPSNRPKLNLPTGLHLPAGKSHSANWQISFFGAGGGAIKKANCAAPATSGRKGTDKLQNLPGKAQFARRRGAACQLAKVAFARRRISPC